MRASLLAISTAFFLITYAFPMFLFSSTPEPQGLSCKGCNLILISLDTVRADYLGVYGYFLNTSPNLDSFSREAILFERAFSQSFWTLPSHASIFSSLYPNHHLTVHRNSTLTNLTITEILSREGYKTYAYTGNAFVSEERGILKGFDEIYYNYDSILFKPFDLAVINTTLDCNGKFFAFFHTYAPHFPYLLPDESKLFFPPPSSSNISLFLRELFDRHHILSQLNRSSLNSFSELQEDQIMKAYHLIRNGSLSEINESSEDDRLFLRYAYSNKIRWADEELGKLLSLLKSKGCLENTIVVILSDHGESFGEHGTFRHRDIYNSNIHVPLMIRLPSKVRGIFRKPVMLVDMVPTLLDLLGIEIEGNFDGRNLFDPGRRKWVVSFQDIEDGELCVIDNGYKLIRFKDHYELYDIVNDFNEENPLNISEHRDVFESLLKLMDDVVS